MRDYIARGIGGVVIVRSLCLVVESAWKKFRDEERFKLVRWS